MIKTNGFVALMAGAGFALLSAGPLLAGSMVEPTGEPEVVVDPAPDMGDEGTVYAGGDPNFDETGGGEVIDDGVTDGDDVLADGGDGTVVDDGTGDVLDNPDVIYYMTGGPEVQRDNSSGGNAAPLRTLKQDRMAANSGTPPASFCRAMFAQGNYGDCGWLYSNR